VMTSQIRSHIEYLTQT